MTRTLRFTTFLAPSIRPMYEAVAEYVGRELGCDTTLVEGQSFDEFADGNCDIGFICGLPYVQLMTQKPSPVELLAAPVLQGNRYEGRPIYFSDVIVRRDSPIQTFDDLRGRSWSYNDCDSHSGYGVTRYHMVRKGQTKGYFGQVVQAGFHQESIRLVRAGEVDASAIDSQVLAVAMRDEPALTEELRIIETLGPSSIQPVVAAHTLPEGLKADVRAALLRMHTDPQGRLGLSHGLVARFAPVIDEDYNDIRKMLAATEAADFIVLR
ncbi:MAG: PhnD/SsuA/transferrin family substrate-binding protein [Chloroflexota bacterium]|nr:PhnD/SsuA/transferrin family substrate-binding protein [Chloroflexota bacterium]